MCRLPKKTRKNDPVSNPDLFVGGWNRPPPWSAALACRNRSARRASSAALGKLGSHQFWAAHVGPGLVIGLKMPSNMGNGYYVTRKKKKTSLRHQIYLYISVCKKQGGTSATIGSNCSIHHSKRGFLFVAKTPHRRSWPLECLELGKVPMAPIKTHNRKRMEIWEAQKGWWKVWKMIFLWKQGSFFQLPWFLLSLGSMVFVFKSGFWLVFRISQPWKNLRVFNGFPFRRTVLRVSGFNSAPTNFTSARLSA